MGRFFLLLLLVFSLLLVGCASPSSPSAFAEKVKENIALPPGVWYEEGREPWQEGCLPAEWQGLFFGEAEMTGLKYRLFVGTDAACPAELLVAEAETVAEAVYLASHLAVRLAEKQAVGGEDLASILSDGAVLRRGRTVLYTLTPSNGRVCAMFK